MGESNRPQTKAQKILAEEKRTAIKTLSAKIDKVRGPGVDDRVARLEELAASLGELFSSAIVSYRDTLKDQVAQASTELFRSMRTETDFQRLSINDQFGLRILDSSGSVVEGRSAGYEHLVALSPQCRVPRVRHPDARLLDPLPGDAHPLPGGADRVPCLLDAVSARSLVCAPSHAGARRAHLVSRRAHLLPAVAHDVS